MFERLETRGIGNSVGKLDRLAVVQQHVEKRPHHRPERMLDDTLAAFGNQRIDDMARLAMRYQRHRLCEIGETACRIPSRHRIFRLVCRQLSQLNMIRP
ncbi:hypothetical protein D3C87_1852720 [compost metagenome]